MPAASSSPMTAAARSADVARIGRLGLPSLETRQRLRLAPQSIRTFVQDAAPVRGRQRLPIRKPPPCPSRCMGDLDISTGKNPEGLRLDGRKAASDAAGRRQRVGNRETSIGGGSLGGAGQQALHQGSNQSASGAAVRASRSVARRGDVRSQPETVNPCGDENCAKADAVFRNKTVERVAQIRDHASLVNSLDPLIASRVGHLAPESEPHRASPPVELLVRQSG